MWWILLVACFLGDSLLRPNNKRLLSLVEAWFPKKQPKPPDPIHYAHKFKLLHTFKVYVSNVLSKHNFTNSHADKWGESLYEFINTHIDSLCFSMNHLKYNYYHMIKKKA